MLVFTFILASSASAAPLAQTAAYILVIDHSLSMTENDPKNIRLDAATLVVDAARPADWIGVVVFAKESRLLIPLRQVNDQQKGEISQQIHSRPGVNPRGTDIIAALESAEPLVKECLVKGIKPTVILLTDGKMEAFDDRWEAKYRDAKGSLKVALSSVVADKVAVQCVALSKEADTAFLRGIAATTGGGYFPANSGDDLLPVYLQILGAGKGMACSESEQFYVWAGASEVNLVLFKNEPSSKIGSITAENAPLSANDQGTYWPRTRPKFYEFVRVLSPRSGNWKLTVDRRSARDKTHIYVLQSLPFDFRIVAPVGGKEIAGTPVRFASELVSRDGGRLAATDPLLSQTGVKVELTGPDGKTDAFDLPRQDDLFATNRTLARAGDFLADFVASFHPPGGNDWTLKVRRIFRTGPPDFEVVVAAPPAGATLTNPFTPLVVRCGFRKLDALSSLNAPPPDTMLRAEITSNGVPVGQFQTWPASDDSPKPVLDGRDTILEPGTYRLIITARHPECTVKPAEQDFRVGEWPEPSDVNVNGRVVRLPDSPEPLVGRKPHFRASLRGGPEQPVEVGDMLNNMWRLEGVKFALELKDRQGTTGFDAGTQVTNSAGAPSTAFDFESPPIRVSGRNEVGGQAHLRLGLVVGGKQRIVREVMQSVPWLSVEVAPLEEVQVAPARLSFASTLVIGKKVGSGWLTVTNAGEKPVEMLAQVGDFKCQDATIPRVFVSVEKEGAGEAATADLKLGVGASAKLRVSIEIVADGGDFRETLPPGTYETTLLLKPRSSGTASRLREIQVPVAVDRK